MSGVSQDQVIIDERLDSLERYRDENDRWKVELENRFAEAFPGGDHVGHCRYHDLMIEQLHDRKRLISAIKEKTISGLVWAAVVGTGAAIWFYLKAQIRGG
jgi:hypothetical protein